MKQLLIFAVILLINNTVLSQETKTDSILTKKQNVEWLLEFKKIKSTKDKLEAIKKKVFEDRVYNVSEKSCFNLVDYDSPYYREKQLLYECKIAFALKIRKGYYLLDLLNNSKSLEILNQVAADYIENIEVLDGKTGEALAFAYFGSSSCGMAIIINSDSRKLKRKIKNVL
jgi:hypothetical protein